MAKSITFKTFTVQINNEEKTVRATTVDDAKKKAQTYCKAHGIKQPKIRVLGSEA